MSSYDKRARPFSFPVFENSERELRQKAYQEGFRQGYDEGRQKVEEVVGRLEAVVRELEGIRERILRSTQEEILELVMAVAKKVIRRELATDREAILRTIEEAITKVTEGDAVKIFLSPDDIEIVRGHQAELLEGGRVVLKADQGITPGGCVIETDFGHVDARIESQLLEIERALKGENGT